jgi:uncharacterized protein YlzI (FlbEa/FlbD family)
VIKLTGYNSREPLWLAARHIVAVRLVDGTTCCTVNGDVKYYVAEKVEDVVIAIQKVLRP